MFEKEMHDMIEAGLLAREVILTVYHQNFDVEIKDDNSPVTEADKGADILIKNYLQERYPSYAFLTEESTDDKTRLDNDYVFIVDPVDGTADFVAKNGEFTTNIALSYKHEVVAGVVLIPAQNVYYYAIKNAGAFKVSANGTEERIHVNAKTTDLTCLTSRFHIGQNEVELLERHSDVIKYIQKVGSSIKACYISEGNAEVSFRLNKGTKEWDTAAFDIIVTEAGGFVLKPDGLPMKYNRENVYNDEGYVVVNRKENILK
ncbi:MAG: 3'(2'),5'-bisphosphate nucleotidase CysQ [Bacilli bacterium]